MAYAVLNTIDAGNTASASTLPTPSTVTLTVGSRVLLVVLYAGNTDQVSSVSDTNGNTWAKIGTSLNNATYGMGYTPFECKNVTVGGATTITANYSGAVTQRGMAGYEFSGLDTSTAAVKAQQIQAAPGTATDAISSSNLTPGSQPGVLFGFTQNLGNNNAYTAGTGFTRSNLTNAQVNGTSITFLEHKRLTATTAVAATATTTFATDNFATVAVFVPESAAIVTTSKLMLLGVG